MEYIYSSKLNQLAEQLIKVIESRRDFFNPFIVVFPNKKVEQWFKAYWLKNNNDVMMNVSCKTIDSLLFDIVNKKNYSQISEETFKLIIIKLLIENDISNIRDYISDDVRLYDFAGKLAQLFFEYERENVEIVGWQLDLYNKAISYANKNCLTTTKTEYERSKDFNNLGSLYLLGFNKFYPLQEEILNEYKFGVTIYFLKENRNLLSNLSILKAPSILREVEQIHSKVCSLLQEDPTCTYSDFLVLAPDISAYYSTVKRVFKQDDIEFPNIPFSFYNNNGVETDVCSGFKTLFNIANKGFFTRLDLFELVKNKTVQFIRGISEDDVDGWKNAIISNNIYRNGKGFDDWHYLKIRILLSKVVDTYNDGNNIVELNDQDYIPYSSIYLNDSSITKFVTLIDDLSNLVNLFKKNVLDSDFVRALIDELDKWFSIKDDNGFETNKEYRPMLNILQNILFLNIPNEKLSLKILLYELLDICQKKYISQSALFTRGISFANFDDYAILQAKYLFFLNANSDVIPPKKVKSEVDLRIDIDDFDYSSLYLQFENTENLFVSYLYKNIVDDSILYPASFVEDLCNRKHVEEQISIDENRNWADLYTRREFKNKDYYNELLLNHNQVIRDETIILPEARGIIKVSEMADFLKEPLKYKATQLFGKNYGDDEAINNEYEDFALNNLDFSILVELVAKVFIKTNDLSNEGLKNDFILKNLLPNINSIILDNNYSRVREAAEEVYNRFSKYPDIEVVNLNDLQLSYGNHSWYLVNRNDIVRSIEGNCRTYIKLSIEKKLSNYLEACKSVLPLYIVSLMDIALLNDQNDYDIILISSDTSKKIEYSLNSMEAKDLLTRIYLKMHDYSNNVFFPIELAKYNPEKQINVAQIMYIIDNAWKYYSDSRLFDFQKQMGINIDDLPSLYSYGKDNIIPLYEKLLGDIDE